jgi:phosphatidylglycerol lysyltransferase
MKKWLKFILVPAAFVIFIVALTILNDQIKSLSYSDIRNAFGNISHAKIILAMGLALLYYILLGGYDIVAYKYIDAKVPLKSKDIAFTCFVSNALGNNTGYSMLFGGSLRYRLYSIHNVSMIAVTKVLFFSSATIWLGLLTIGGIVFTFAPVPISQVLGYDISSRVIGIFFLSILTVYISLSILNLKSLYIFKKKITLPNIKIVAWQIFLATTDWIIASLTLWILMPAGEISYWVLLKVFLIAQLLGILSQVPGGMGVFEASIALLLPHIVNNPEVISGLLIYRVVFYFFPLFVALTMLASYEIARLAKKVDEKTKMIGKAVSSIITQVLGILLFFAGIFTIFLNFTPLDVSEMKKIFNFVPYWFSEAFHFILTLIAAELLLVSRAVQLRIKQANTAACVLLGIAIIILILSQKFIPIIIYFVLLFIVLINSRNYFYRTKSMLLIPFGALWYYAIAAALFLSAWIGFFINKGSVFPWASLDISLNALISNSDAAQYVRSAIAVILIFIIIIIQRLFGKLLNEPVVFDRKDIDKIINSADFTYAFAAFSPDKNFIVDKKKKAFIMYGQSGNHNIALGDPVGEGRVKGELVWNFKEASDAKSKILSFVGIDSHYFRYYKDIGLNILLIGREAKIKLSAFSKNDYFHLLEKQAQEKGLIYEIIKNKDFEKYRDIFCGISNFWEEETNYIKRNFVPGDYDENNTNKNDYSVLKRNGEIFAFSVIEKTKNMNEFSSSIVRYKNCSQDELAYLIYKNVCYAKEKKYILFDLGLAYFEQDSYENTFINHFAKIYAYSEHFNNDVKRTCEFKNKFNPVWTRKYAAISLDAYIHIRTFIRNFTALISPMKKGHKLIFFRRFFSR